MATLYWSRVTYTTAWGIVAAASVSFWDSWVYALRCLFDPDQLIAQLVTQTYLCEKGARPQNGCLSRWIVSTDLPSEADRCMDLLPSDLHADLLGRRTHTLGLTLRWFAADNKSVGAERRHPTLVCSRMQTLQQHTGVDTGLPRSTLGT